MCFSLLIIPIVREIFDDIMFMCSCKINLLSMCTSKYLTDVYIFSFELFIIKLSSGADWLSMGVIIRAVDLLGFIVSLFILIQFETAFNSLFICSSNSFCDGLLTIKQVSSA